MGINFVHELLSAADSAALRSQLKVLLRKDLERVLEQARTSLPLPNRIWRRADDHSACLPLMLKRTDFVLSLTVSGSPASIAFVNNRGCSFQHHESDKAFQHIQPRFCLRWACADATSNDKQFLAFLGFGSCSEPRPL